MVQFSFFLCVVLAYRSEQSRASGTARLCVVEKERETEATISGQRIEGVCCCMFYGTISNVVFSSNH